MARVEALSGVDAVLAECIQVDFLIPFLRMRGYRLRKNREWAYWDMYRIRAEAEGRA
jgi:hypothetical protein